MTSTRSTLGESSASRADPGGGGLTRVGRIAVVVLPAVALAVAGWLRRWTTDDAFINYRIVRMLIEGHGPVFNVGQRVEAYTSPLWLGILAVGDVLLPLRLEYVSIASSLALSVGGMVALGAGSMRLLGRSSDHAWLPLGSLILLALPPMWDFSTAGLEFGLSLFWIGGLTWVLARWAIREAPLQASEAVFVGLGPLVRPEMTVYTAAILVVVLASRWRAESHRQRLAVASAALALPVVYELFRMAYFASLVPNTVLAKAADRPHWREGLAYLTNMLAPYYLLLPLALAIVVAVVAARPFGLRRRLSIAVLPAAGCIHALFIVRAGGDYMHARLLLPSLVAVLAPVAVAPIRRSLVPVAAVVTSWAVVAAAGLRMTEPVKVEHTLVADGRQAAIGPLHVENPVTAEDQGFGPGSPQVRSISDGGVYAGFTRLPVQAQAGVPTPVVMMLGIGVVGYSLGSKVNVVDRLGLADALTARLRVTQRGFIGHEKPIPAPWLAARVTDDPVQPDDLRSGIFARPLYESPQGRFEQDVSAARRALSCPALRRLQTATQGRMTMDRALSNFWHAPSLTSLQVPPDPKRAVDELC